jgi:hypothetical protein
MNVPLVPTPRGLPVQIRQSIKQLATALDELVKHADYMVEVADALDEAEKASDRQIKRAKDALKHWRESETCERLRSGWFKAAHEQLIAAVPEREWWESNKPDGAVNPSVIIVAVGALVGAFPQNASEPYVAQLIEDVLSWKPHPFEIDTAWTELRLNKTFLPSIAEVHKAYRAAQTLWINRWECEDCAEYNEMNLEKLIAEAESQS